MINIHVKQQIDASKSQLLAELLDHVNLSRFFNAKFELVRTQKAGEITGGAGSMRQVSMLGTSFIEEIVSASDSGICYRIVGSKPLKQHAGKILFTEVTPTTTMVDYHISGTGPWFLPDSLLQFFIGRDIEKAVNKLARLYLWV